MSRTDHHWLFWESFFFIFILVVVQKYENYLNFKIFFSLSLSLNYCSQIALQLPSHDKVWVSRFLKHITDFSRVYFITKNLPTFSNLCPLKVINFFLLFMRNEEPKKTYTFVYWFFFLSILFNNLSLSNIKLYIYIYIYIYIYCIIS